MTIQDLIEIVAHAKVQGMKEVPLVMPVPKRSKFGRRLRTPFGLAPIVGMTRDGTGVMVLVKVSKIKKCLTREVGINWNE